MSEKLKKIIRPVLFAAGGAAAGFAYYMLIGCPDGSCAITSNPFVTMAYFGLIGGLLSGVIGKGCDGKCNM